MSAWVLVIMFGVSSTTAAVTVEMPDQRSCYLALKDSLKERRVAGGFCLERTVEKR